MASQTGGYHIDVACMFRDVDLDTEENKEGGRERQGRSSLELQRASSRLPSARDIQPQRYEREYRLTSSPVDSTFALLPHHFLSFDGLPRLATEEPVPNSRLSDSIDEESETGSQPDACPEMLNDGEGGLPVCCESLGWRIGEIGREVGDGEETRADDG